MSSSIYAVGFSEADIDVLSRGSEAKTVPGELLPD
jgi:hypothetical protein